MKYLSNEEEIRIVEAPEPRQTTEFELPDAYGVNSLVLLVRDPWWLFAYWEVTADRESEVLRLMKRQGLDRDKTVLRVYDVTDTSLDAAHSFFDIELNIFAKNWYIDVGRPDRQWIVELGYRARSGRFFMVVRSNLARTPRFGISDTLDEDWMIPDELYWKIFGLSAGLADLKSSLTMREILERYLKGIVSSGGSSQFSQILKQSKNEPSVEPKLR